MPNFNDPDDDTHKDDDLAERAAKFGELAIAFAREIDADDVTIPLISQFIEAATSIGGNYYSASAATGGPDFSERIRACIEKVNATKYWIRMITAAAPDHSDAGRTLWKEVHELGLAFETLERYNTRRTGRGQ